MDRALYDAVLARLRADESLDEVTAARIASACRARCRPEDEVEPVRAWLRWIEVEGFRGIGAPVRLELDAAPGLVVIAGRNGSGKSSLAEGLEVLLTGSARRWSDRTAEFRRSWPNLHHPGARVAAGFLVEGSGRPLVLERTWPEGEGRPGVLRIDGAVADLGSIGWSDAVESWRPILSGDLSRRLEGTPSALFDAMAGVLGLESLVEASAELAEERRELRARGREVRDALPPLREALARSDDPRARHALEMLAADPPDLDALDALVRAGPEGAQHLDDLRAVASMEVPDPEEVRELARRLREAAGRVHDLAEGLAGRGDRLAGLLEVALDLREAGERDCPVCGAAGVLDPAWVARARAQLAEAREAARALGTARRELGEWVQRGRDLLGSPDPVRVRRPAVLERPRLAPLLDAWRGGRDLEGEALAAHLEAHVDALAEELAGARDAAREQLERQQAAWMPLAARLREWVARRRHADAWEVEAQRLEVAERWLSDAENSLRVERFAPIAQAARTIWDRLRQESHVALESIELRGNRTRRRLSLEARVDDAEAGALGVMSQGELNALALSLFVPRTTLPESPFRFLLVDDPVQAMDPHKVDGLALVLSDLARTRQTLVFTHDERLLESLRRLRRPAKVWGVQRGPRSVVTLVARREPVTQALEDAALVLSAPSLDPAVVARLVPGFCREAVEARLVEILRRRWIGTGVPHAEVEERLARHRGLRALAALALFDDARAGREVEEKLAQRFGPEAAETFGQLNAGAHGEAELAPHLVLRRTRRLVTALEAVT